MLVTELIFIDNLKKNPIKKSHRLVVEGTRAILTSGLAYRNMSSLQDFSG